MDQKKPSLQLRTIHRVVTVFVVLFTVYLGFTGTVIQLIDLRSLFTHAPAVDPNVRAMREAFDGPGAFQVIATSDHVAPPLPAETDFDAMLTTTVKAARATLGAAPLRFVELRMEGGRPVGQVRSEKPELRFDAVTGESMGLAPPGLNENEPPASERNTFKHLHRMTVFGDAALWINVFVAVALAIMIVTGVVMYVKLFLGRARTGRSALFWAAGGTWKTLHRAISTIAAVFLVVVTLSGSWLAVESLVFGYRMTAARGQPRVRPPDALSPLNDAALPDMLHTTLAAYDKAMPGVPVRVVQLRVYNGMPQGAVVSDGEVAKQLVFNTNTGRRVNSDELAYYPKGFPFGWQAHQVAKSVHRGDFIGMPGRLMDLIAGLSMLYLSISGIVMYWELWTKRRRAGRKALIWI
jgi:uncharacterized iron-regulated membrane protein